MHKDISRCSARYFGTYRISDQQSLRPICKHAHTCKSLPEEGGSYLGDNCIQNFHLGRYIVGNTVGNLVLRRRVSGAVKRDFRTYIRRYTSLNENFGYGYPNSNALLTFSLKKDSKNVLCCAYTSSGCQLHKTACQLHIFTC